MAEKELELTTVIDGTRRRFPLAGENISVGRGSENDIVLSDFSVSRRHAMIRHAPAGSGEAGEKAGWIIEDLKSTNGVILNGVEGAQHALTLGDRLKIGVFELTLEEMEDISQATPADLPAATIIRPLADFSAEFGIGTPEDVDHDDKRKSLDKLYSSKSFGILTRLARTLISTDSIEGVLSEVMEIAFEALPVDRGFILMRDDRTGETSCEMARSKDRVEFQPQGEVPVSQTMVETVMTQRVALVTSDALADQRLEGGESIRIHQIRSAMCAPLWSGEKIIGVFQVDSPVHVGSLTEQDLDLLTALANYAAMAVERIRYAQRVEHERLVRSRLERYHSPTIIENVMREGEAPAERQLRLVEATVLFADLVGFTTYCESVTPEEIADLLHGYFTHAVEAIFDEGGTLDKFIGDCVMAFFGAPMEQSEESVGLESHALRGVRAAIAIQSGQQAWNESRRERDLPELACRVALNSGPVVVGDIGSDRRVDYTILGNTINIASRLESAVADPGDIVIGQATHALLAGSIDTESLGEHPLKGLQQKITAYRVLGSSA